MKQPSPILLLSASLFLILSGPVQPTSEASAKTVVAPRLAKKATAVSSIAESITVRIEGQNPGSGVLIKRRNNTYTVLTAAHVVATEDEYDLVTPDEKRYPLAYSTVRKFPGVDLALIEFTSPQSYPVAELGDSNVIRSGASVYVSGFPMPTAAITEPIWTFSPGTVTAHARRKALADGYALVYTNSTLPGMSGGAVLDEAGKLIGIHGRADTEELSQKTETVYVKTGFNLGIPIQTFLTLAPQVDAALGFVATDSPSIPTALTADDWYLSAADKYDKGDYRGAIADFNQALQLQPDFASAYFNRGVLYAALGDNTAAMRDYNQALKVQPDFVEVYLNRGLTHKRLGNFQAALADYNQAIRLKPDYGKAYNNRGNVRKQLGDREGAYADYNQAIHLQPDHAPAYRNRGLEKTRVGDKRGAIADFSKAIEFKPNFAEAYLNRGYERSALGDQTGAIADYSKAIEFKPDYGEAYGNRAIVRSMLGDRRGAIEDAKRAAQIFQRQGRQGDYRKALGLIDELSR